MTGLHLRRGPLPMVAASAPLVLMTRAYALDRAPIVTGATYTATLWALLGDVFVFRTWPDVNAWVGGAMVLSSSVWLVVRRGEAAVSKPSPREPVHHDA